MQNECLQPKATAQAKAKPSQAQANSPGLAWDFSRPEPLKARPNPWLSGQAKASTSLSMLVDHSTARFTISSIDEICQFLNGNSAIISGSYALLAFHGAIFELGDLDIYAPTNRQVDIDAYLKGKSYVRLEGPSAYAAENPSIKRTVQYSRGAMTIDVVYAATNCAIQVVPEFFSTTVMNFVGWYGAVCLYPGYTLSKLSIMNADTPRVKTCAESTKATDLDSWRHSHGTGVLQTSAGKTHHAHWLSEVSTTEIQCSYHSATWKGACLFTKALSHGDWTAIHVAKRGLDSLSEKQDPSVSHPITRMYIHSPCIYLKMRATALHGRNESGHEKFSTQFPFRGPDMGVGGLWGALGACILIGQDTNKCNAITHIQPLPATYKGTVFSLIFSRLDFNILL